MVCFIFSLSGKETLESSNILLEAVVELGRGSPVPGSCLPPYSQYPHVYSISVRYLQKLHCVSLLQGYRFALDRTASGLEIRLLLAHVFSSSFNLGPPLISYLCDFFCLEFRRDFFDFEHSGTVPFLLQSLR